MKNKNLRTIYRKLYQAFGPQHWWPAKTDFEVIVGAILTQNTSWTNVEKAITNLRSACCLTPKKLIHLKKYKLAELIRPSGYFNIKADRLKHFLRFLFREYKGDVNKMLGGNLKTLREKLLRVKGIGPETADSIILYAANKPVFVIDAYTKRIFSRHGIIKNTWDYDKIQKFFMSGLPRNAKLFNEYHALIVNLGKNICRNRPKCKICPINPDFAIAKSARRAA